MKEFRRINLYINEITNQYWISSDGYIYSEQTSREVRKRVGEKMLSKSFAKEYKIALNEIIQSNLQYKIITVFIKDIFEKKVVILNNGIILRKLSNHVPENDDYAYPTIAINTINGKRKMYHIHSLVAKCFLSIDDDIFSGYKGAIEIHHIDLNKKNNDVTNLVFMKKEDHMSLHHNKNSILIKKKYDIIK